MRLQGKNFFDEDCDIDNSINNMQLNESQDVSHVGTSLNGTNTLHLEMNDSKYNRKEKSLGELCRRFLSYYGKAQKDLLLLDQCTKEL